MSANLENSAVATGLEKVSFLQSQRRAMPKNVQTIIQLCSFPLLVRLCSKSFKLASAVCELRTSRCASWVLKRQRNQRSNCQHPLDHQKTKEIPEKNLLLLHWLCWRLSVDHKKLWKILKEMGIPDHLTCLLRNLYADQEATVRTRHEITGSKLEKEYDNVTYCHLAYLNSMQSTSCEMPGRMNHKLESRFLGEIPTTSEKQMIL